MLIGCLLWSCQQQSDPIRLATYTYATNDRIDNMKLLAQELELTLQQKVDRKSYPDVRSFIKAIKSNEVDIALINTLGYLRLASDNAHMIPIANLRVKEDAIDNYKTVILTTNDNITDFAMIGAQAKDLRMMFVKEGSTSGNLIPRLFLSSIGISSPETQFKEVQYGGNHTSTFEKLLQGKTDMCAIGSNEYFQQLQSDSTLKETVNLLWISDEIPLGPVLINKNLSVVDQEAISALILNLHLKNPAALEAVKAGWSEAKQAVKFQSITDEYYDSFREVNGNRTRFTEILKQFED